MKALIAYILNILGLSFIVTIYPMDHAPSNVGFTNLAHVIYAYYYNLPNTQEEIEKNRKNIAASLYQLRTLDDLYLPIHIPHRMASMAQVPAIFDLILKKRNADLIEIIVAKNIPLIVQTQNSRSIFHELAALGKSKVMKLFLDLYKKYNRDPAELIEAQTTHLWTPLMVAATYAHTACVKLLLEHGAREYCLNKEFESALHLAVANNHKRGKSKINQIVNMLCKAGVEVNQKNKNNLTARAIASKNSLFRAVEIIDKYTYQSDCTALRIKGETQTYFAQLPEDIVLSALMLANPATCAEKVIANQTLEIT